MLKDQISHHIYHYNHERFWKWRKEITDNNCKLPKIVKVLKLIYLKRCEAFNNAYLATTIGGAKFETAPILPHGLNGIVISCYSKIGANVTILQQVTIGQIRTNDNKAPIIGNNVYIGAGAKIFGDIRIGNNVNIGANAVVLHDVPDNCTVVGVPARIIKRKDKINDLL